jgi:hypothetical protein
VASEQQIAANRRNARKSTGPRSRAGKRVAMRGDRLAACITSSETFAKEVDQLARKIAGDADSAIALAHARVAAEAELDLARVRRTKVTLIERIAAVGPLDPRPAYNALQIFRLYLKASGLRSVVTIEQYNCNVQYMMVLLSDRFGKTNPIFPSSFK